MLNLKTTLKTGLLLGLLFAAGPASACCGGDAWLADDNAWTGTNEFQDSVGISGSLEVDGIAGFEDVVTLSGGFKLSATGDLVDEVDFSNTCGSHTPTVYGTSTAGSCTYSQQVAHCGVFGKFVMYEALLTWTSCSVAPAGDLVTPLPAAYPAASTGVFGTDCAISYFANYTLTSTGYQPKMYLLESTDYVLFEQLNTGVNPNTKASAPVDTAASIAFTCIYLTD